MNMRHNEIFLNNDNEYVTVSKTTIGRYSQWSDHSDVYFFDVYKQKNLEFKPFKICFLVPLIKKDLFILRTENKSGIISEQFVYCAFSEKFETYSFAKWISFFALNFIFKSITGWYIIFLKIFNQDIATLPSLWFPLLAFIILYRLNKFYSFKKLMVIEISFWILISLVLTFVRS